MANKRNHGRRSVLDNLSRDDRSWVYYQKQSKLEELAGHQIDGEIARETSVTSREIAKSKRDIARSLQQQVSTVGDVYDKAVEAGANKAKADAAKQTEITKLFEEHGLDADIW